MRRCHRGTQQIRQATTVFLVWVLCPAAATAQVPEDSGPSTVRPSTLAKPAGNAIKRSSKEVVRASAMKFPAEKDVCRDEVLVTDLFKAVAFDVDAELRRFVPLSVKEEVKVGRRLSDELAASAEFKGKIDTPATRAWSDYLARVATPLLAHIQRKGIDYHFHVIDSDEVNAFAILGGHIYFFTGLLENQGGDWLENEAQLAGILAHEIGHIDLGHTAAVFQYLKAAGVRSGEGEGLATIAVALARWPFSSNQEDQADEFAAATLYRSQYAPNEFARMWQTWAETRGGKTDGRTKDVLSALDAELGNVLETHPSYRDRACNVRRRTLQARKETRGTKHFYVGSTNLERRVARSQQQF